MTLAGTAVVSQLPATILFLLFIPLLSLKTKSITASKYKKKILIMFFFLISFFLGLVMLSLYSLSGLELIFCRFVRR